MGSTDDEMQEAQVEVERLHEVLLGLEAERAAASERVEQIAAESFDTPEQEADISRRVELADEEVGRIDEKIAEVEGDFRRAQEDFDALLFDAGDDDGDDTSESLSVWDAADIWLSNGKDEDYMSGYTAEELERAANER